MGDQNYKGIGFLLAIIVLCVVVVICGNRESSGHADVAPSKNAIQPVAQATPPTIWRAAYSESDECMDTEFIPTGRVTHFPDEDYTFTIIEDRGDELIVENSDVKNVVSHFFKTRDECDLARSKTASK